MIIFKTDQFHDIFKTGFTREGGGNMTHPRKKQGSTRD